MGFAYIFFHCMQRKESIGPKALHSDGLHPILRYVYILKVIYIWACVQPSANHIILKSLERRIQSSDNRNMKLANFVTLLVLLLFILPLQNATEAAPPCPQPGKHFVLVHGACHGAWSWYKLVSLIRSSGHNVTSLDMATSGISPKQVYRVKDSVSDYFQPLREFMASIPPKERVILVGHSYGGLGIAQAMEMFPEKIAVAVFVAAAMVGPKLNVSTLGQESKKRRFSIEDSHYIYGNGPSNPPTAFAFGPKDLATNLYQRSPSEDLALATLLVRPIYLYSVEDLSEELVLSTGKYGSVSRVFIVADEDRNPGKDYQEWMIEKNPPNEVYHIEGADHMVMISKPVELFFLFWTLLGDTLEF